MALIGCDSETARELCEQAGERCAAMNRCAMPSCECQCITQAELAIVDALLSAEQAVIVRVRDAMDRANGRWSEWGSRATMVEIHLRHAIGEITDQQRDEELADND